MQLASSLVERSLRFRGADAAGFLSKSTAQHRCVTLSLSAPASGGSVESSFSRRERCSRVHAGARAAEVHAAVVPCAGVQIDRPAVAPLPWWQAMNVGGFDMFSPLCSASFAGVESIAGQRSRGWGGSVAGAHNTRLQRTVIRRHVRACGAHDTLSRGR